MILAFVEASAAHPDVGKLLVLGAGLLVLALTQPRHAQRS
jgi:hypothetical protein